MNDMLKTMVWPLAQSYARHAVAGWGIWLLQAGIIKADQQSQFEGSVMFLAMVAWTTWDKYGRAIVDKGFAKLRSHVDAIPTITPAVPPSPSQVAATSAAISTAKAAAAMLAIAIILAALAPGSAHAQVRKPQITGNIIADTKANLGITKPGDAPALTGDPVADLHNAIKKGGAKLLMHLKQQYALAISPGSDGSTQVDPIAAPCAKALVPIVDLVVNGPKATTVAPPDAMALTADEQTAAADASELDGVLVQVEKIRILRIAVQGNALTIACGPLVQDEVKQAKNLMGGITSLITGAGLLAPIGL